MMSVSATQSLDAIKSELKKQKDMGDNIETDLYSHLCEVFTRIMQYHPYDGFDKFEEISVMVKKTHMKSTDAKFDYELNN